MCTTLSPNATSRVKLSVLRCVLGALAGVFMISWQASEAANLNLSALKSSHTYTPYAGEPLERIIAKTMPNSPLKTELLGQAFRSLNPQQFSSATSNLVKTNNALPITINWQIWCCRKWRRSGLLKMKLNPSQPTTQAAARNRPISLWLLAPLWHVCLGKPKVGCDFQEPMPQLL